VRTGISQAKKKQKFTAADLGNDLIAKVVYTVGLYPPKLLRLLPLRTCFAGFILKPGAIQPGEDLAGGELAAGGRDPSLGLKGGSVQDDSTADSPGGFARGYACIRRHFSDTLV
jgi:hypothetical protein